MELPIHKLIMNWKEFKSICSKFSCEELQPSQKTENESQRNDENSSFVKGTSFSDEIGVIISDNYKNNQYL